MTKSPIHTREEVVQLLDSLQRLYHNLTDNEAAAVRTELLSLSEARQHLTEEK